MHCVGAFANDLHSKSRLHVLVLNERYVHPMVSPIDADLEVL